MGKREDNIENEVNNICGECLATGLFDIAREKLRKLYLKEYDKLNNMCTKRNLLYRLIFAERMSTKGTEMGVKIYVIQLKHDMDSTLNYKEEYTKEYLDMLSYYFDCSEIQVEEQEMTEYYKFAYDYYKDIYNINQDFDDYIRMINMEFNINRIERNFPHILSLIKDIHNIKDDKMQSTLEQMLCDIKKMDKGLYDKAIEITHIIFNISNK